MSETPQANFINAQEGIDLNKLADAFEAQGNMAEALRLRNLAKKEPQTTSGLTALWDRKEQEERQKVEEELHARPQVPHNPKLDARVLSSTTLEGIKNMLQPTTQNKPPSAPNAPKSPTPSGGK